MPPVLSLYLASLALGGVVLGVSLVGGGHGDVDTDGGGADHDGHGQGGDSPSAFLPFLSLRFWTFAFAFFGATGALLTWLGLAAPLVIGLLAGGVGSATGYVAARVLTALKQQTVGALPSADAHVGREGTLLLPVAADQRGKLRLALAGHTVDLVAETDGAPLPIGAAVVIVEMRGATAIVAPIGILTEKSTIPAEGER